MAMNERLLFVCQQCHSPLEVTASSLQDSTLDAFQNTSVPSHLPSDHKQREGRALDMLAESFVVLPPAGGDPRPEPQSTQWEKRITALTRVMEVASDKCQVDQPLCSGCSEAIVKELLSRIQANESDAKVYEDRLQSLASDPRYNVVGTPTSTPDDEADTSTREAELLRELESLRQERLLLQREETQLLEEAKEVRELEQAFWLQYQDFVTQEREVGHEQVALSERIVVATSQLERMKRTNVYDDAFHIYYDGHFGTINGFRLGRLPSQPVDWQEINAALGQVVLLLQTVARHCDFPFTKYNLIPLGSFSKISRKGDPTSVHELYGSNDLNWGRLFWYRRFDTALVWLLECVQEFGEYARRLDPSFKPKYSIVGDAIEGISIKMQFNQDAKWTKALKYMLTNIKFLLAWASKHKDH